MSTTAKQVMDIKTSKGIAQSSNEQLRRWTENGWEQAAKEGNYDYIREHNQAVLDEYSALLSNIKAAIVKE